MSGCFRTATAFRLPTFIFLSNFDFAMMKYYLRLLLTVLFIKFSANASAQIGARFPSEKKIVKDPVTGVMLTFLTSTPAGDSKIYQTHPQWTSDGKWLVFRSQRVAGQAFAVNEESGAIVQVTSKGFTGMLCVSRLAMKLYHMRGEAGGGRGGPRGPLQLV